MTEFLEQLVNEIGELKLRVVALEQRAAAVPVDQEQERGTQPAAAGQVPEELTVWSEADSTPSWEEQENFPVWEESPGAGLAGEQDGLSAGEDAPRDSEEAAQPWLKRFTAGPWFKIIGILALLLGIACILKLFLR